MTSIPMLNLRREYEFMKSGIDAAIARCLKHQQWILGPEVGQLEQSIARTIEVKHAVGVTSGTDALILALRAIAIRTRGREYFDRKDEIITTPFTFVATGGAILHSGATPVFVDIDPATYTIDPKKIQAYLSRRSSRVVGIVPVHLYGQACEMDRIMSLAKKYRLFVLEDVAQAFGGRWKKSMLGSIGTAGTLSFFPSKNLGGFGDGGMVTTNDPELARVARMLMKHGGEGKHDARYLGYNARLDTLQAAVLLAKLKFADRFNRKRRAIAKQYTRILSRTTPIVTPTASPHAFHVYHQYTVRVPDRDRIQAELRKKGISTMTYYPVPLHRMEVFRGRCIVPEKLIHTERAAREVLSLPIEPLMTAGEMKSVAEGIQSLLG